MLKDLGLSCLCVHSWPCPKVSNGISPSAGSGRNPAVFYDLYRHTFLKDCGSHDKKTPAWGMEREPDPAPGAGRKGVISGHLVLVENGSFWAILGLGPWRGSFSATEYSPLIP